MQEIYSMILNTSITTVITVIFLWQYVSSEKEKREEEKDEHGYYKEIRDYLKETRDYLKELVDALKK